MNKLGRSLENLDFVAFRSATPLRVGDIAAIESECVAAPRRFPTETVLCESTLPRLFGQVQEDIVEVLAVWPFRLVNRAIEIAPCFTYKAAILTMGIGELNGR